MPHPMFTGSALSVRLQGRTAQIKGRAAPSMTDLLMSGMVVQNASPQEIIHATMRSAGLPEERLEIQGIESQPIELFEVIVPVTNLVVTESHRVGPAWLIAKERGLSATAGFGLDEESEDLVAEFKDSDSYLLAIVLADRLFDAEARGLEAVDLALAWLATRGRYGLATLPSGRGQDFSRARSLTAPSRGRSVLARGLATRRRWIRRPAQLMAAERWKIGQGSAGLEPALPSQLSVSDRQALSALYLAITESDQVMRAQALWQAVEAYAGETRVPRLFTKTERRRLAASIPNDLSAVQKERVRSLYGELNRPSLMDRLRARLADDAVPVSGGETELLERVRTLRNDVTHGREPSVRVDREDLEHAVSVVARILVYSVAAADPSA